MHARRLEMSLMHIVDGTEADKCEHAGAMHDDNPPECTACAACCFSTLERYVEVRGSDYARLGDDAERLVHFIGNRAYMRIVDGHCAALDVDVDNRCFRCTVYDNRPATCRDLERGSPACKGELVTKRERPLLALLRNARGPISGAVAITTDLERGGECTPPTNAVDDVEVAS